MSHVIRIEDQSSLAEVRRIANRAADAEDLSTDARGRLALVISEACTNLVKHATGGEIHVAGLSKRYESGVEVLAIDRGPGIENLDRVMEDGFSTTGTAGTGLGAIRRASQTFDIYSTRGKGTVVMAQIGNPGSKSTAGITIGAVEKAFAPEPVSGDAWSVSWEESIASAILVDGLGHGIAAAEAANEAISAFDRHGSLGPAAFLQRAHLSLRATRGAAASVAVLNFEKRQVSFGGLGNVSGWLVGTSKMQAMVSHNGTLGLSAPRFQEFTYPLPDPGFLVMHSDGLLTNWEISPLARNRHPSVIAALLYRDSSRGRDDVCVLVIKPKERAS